MYRTKDPKQGFRWLLSTRQLLCFTHCVFTYIHTFKYFVLTYIYTSKISNWRLGIHSLNCRFVRHSAGVSAWLGEKYLLNDYRSKLVLLFVRWRCCYIYISQSVWGRLTQTVPDKTNLTQRLNRTMKAPAGLVGAWCRQQRARRQAESPPPRA